MKRRRTMGVLRRTQASRRRVQDKTPRSGVAIQRPQHALEEGVKCVLCQAPRMLRWEQSRKGGASSRADGPHRARRQSMEKSDMSGNACYVHPTPSLQPETIQPRGSIVLWWARPPAVPWLPSWSPGVSVRFVLRDRWALDRVSIQWSGYHIS